MPALADCGGQQPGIPSLQGRKQAHVLGVVGSYQEVQWPIQLNRAAVVGGYRIAPGQPVQLVVPEADVAARRGVRRQVGVDVGIAPIEVLGRRGIQAWRIEWTFRSARFGSDRQCRPQGGAEREPRGQPDH